MEYDSSKQINPLIGEVLEAIKYKDLIAQLIRRDITTKYKRSVLGIVWTMLNPLGLMVIMTLVFQDFFHRQAFYSVYVLSGMLTFTFFNQASTSIIHNLIWGEDLFQRIYIPRSTFAIAAVGTASVNLVLALVPLMLVALVLGSPLSWKVIFFPIYVVYLACFSLGIGLIVASLALHFHDIADIYQVLLTAWFYATPIIYPYDTLTPTVKHLLYFNPMSHIVQLMRNSFYYNYAPTIQELLVTGAFALAALLIGWFMFSRQTEEFVLR